MIKKVLLAIVIGFVALLLIGIFAGKPEKTVGTSGATATEAKTEDPPVQVQAKTLAADYEENTVAADQKYKGKKLLITGSVTDINTGITGEPYIVLSSANPFMGPQLHFGKDALDQIAKVKKGAKITALCEGNGDIAKTPMNKDCVLQ